MIEFVLTQDCRVFLLAKDAVFSKLRIDVDINAFLSGNGVARLIESLVEALSKTVTVTADQITVSEVRSGSAFVMFQVSPTPTPVDTTKEEPEVPSVPTFADSIATSLIAAIDNSALDVDGEITDNDMVLSSSDPEPENPEPTIEEQEAERYEQQVSQASNIIKGIVAILAVLFVCIVCIATGVIVVIVFLKRGKQVAP